MLRWLVLCLIVATPAAADTWPTRPVRLIVPFAPGGSTDVGARALAVALSIRIGQQVVVENRGGAGGLIGSDMVAKAAPDGHTLLWGTTAVMAIARHVYTRIPYDPEADFTPVSLVMRSWQMILGSPKLEANTLAELIAAAKARPGAFNFASGGNGSATHLYAERLKFEAGIDMVHVPFRGSGAAHADLLSGAVHALFESMPAAIGQVRSGQMKALAVTGPQRSPLAPNVPTVIEAGVPGFVTSAWFAMFAPAKLPPPVLEKLLEQVQAAAQDPEFRSRIGDIGLDVVASSPAELATTVREESARAAAVVQRIGLKLDPT